MDKTFLEYGFPDPHLRPSFDPWYALLLALREREIVTDETILSDEDFGEKLQLYKAELTGRLTHITSSEFADFDRRLSEVCKRFINTNKHFDPGNPPFWAWPELLEFAAGKNKPVVTPLDPLAHKLAAEYAIQRMAAVRALRVTCEESTRLWEEHSVVGVCANENIQNTARSAINWAISHAEKATSFVRGRQVFSVEAATWESDTGGRRHGYSAEVDVAGYFFAPGDFSVSSTMYAFAATNGCDFFGYGSVREGWNVFTSDNGFRFDIDQIRDNAIAGKTRGFNFADYVCTYDFGAVFRFAPPLEQ